MKNNSKLYNTLIWVISIVVPLVVALLLFAKWDYDKLIFDLRIPNYEPIVLLENLPIAKPLTLKSLNISPSGGFTLGASSPGEPSKPIP